MAYIKEHCADCRKLLGKDFAEVHRFLDQFSKQFPVEVFNEYHRGFLHNSYGLYLVKLKFNAEEAFRTHIARDYYENYLNPEIESGLLVKVLNKSDKALLFFNDLRNLDWRVWPQMIVTYCKDEGLCSKHFKEGINAL